MKDNIPMIVNLRAIAALSVVIFHIGTSNDLFHQDSFIYNIFFWGHKGVQIFFTISSIVITQMLLKLNYDLSKFFLYMKRRWLRIYPPFFISYIIIYGYIIFRTHHFDFKSFLSNIFLIVPYFKELQWLNNFKYSIYWTLSIEWVFYIFLGLSFMLASSHSRFKRYVFYGIAILIHFFSTYYYFSNYSLIFEYWISYFLIGVVYTLYKNKILSFYEALITTFIFSLLTIYRFGYIDFLICITTIALINYIPNFKTKILTYLGEISYSIYLVQIFTSMPMINFLSKYTHQWYEKTLAIILSLAFCIVVAHYFYKYIEHTSHQLSKKISK